MSVMMINQAEVAALLPMAECIAVLESAFKALARGEATLPLRPIMWLPERVGLLGMMPAYLADRGMMGLKVLSIFPGNANSEYDSHQGAVLLFEAQHGRLLAILDAAEITAIRTAAASGLATRLLARPDAGHLAILGSGVQARSHLAAMLAVRAIAQAQVWSRNPAHAAAFAAWAQETHGLVVRIASDVQTAVAEADIICTVTAAREPILHGAWLKPGAHINAVGSSTPMAREVDTAALIRARLYVDRRESALNEAGDFLIPKAEGAVDDDHIVGEIGELLLGQAPGRQSDEEITLFKSLGLAIEDVAAAHYVYQKAVERGMGTAVELGGRRHV